MYAVVEQGGKQFKVAEGDVINIDLTDVAPDAKGIELEKVLLVSDGEKVKVGTPYLAVSYTHLTLPTTPYV